MAGLDRRKTNSTQTSWEFYIEGNDAWLKTPLRAEMAGELMGPDGLTPSYRFSKNEPIQILDTHLHDMGAKKMAKVSINGITGWTLIRYISKPTTVLRTSESGERVQERQERSVIMAINDAVAANNGGAITLACGTVRVTQVMKARKNEGLNFFKKEKYADMILTLSSGKELGVSMKMNKAPSLLGGGLEALYEIDPKYIVNITNKALQMALNDKRFEIGSNKKLTDIFIEFSNRTFIEKALRGTVRMGGPVHYMFVGTAEPKHILKKNVLMITDSKMYGTRLYAQHIGKFYLRIRRRDAGQIFTNQIDNKGIPFFFKKPNGSERARFVVDKTLSGAGLLVKD